MSGLSFYRGKRVFITGHTGFKGAWLARILTNAGAQVTGYALAPPTQPNLFQLLDVQTGLAAHHEADIRDFDTLRQAVEQARPEIVFHLAAQPIVRESYRTPRHTYETNVMGTVNLLEALRLLDEPPRSILNVTTDKVYDNREWEWGYRETDALDGYDPYSNSKSCSELVTHSYARAFFAQMGVRVSTARAGNVIGGGDFAADRIIPDCVRAMEQAQEIVLRNPHSTRPYQHVLEPLGAYLLIARRQNEDEGCAGAYNVGPEEADCMSTGALAELFCQNWGENAAWRVQGDGGPHEATFLKLDCARIKTRLGWKPRLNIDEALGLAVEWYRAFLQGGDVAALTDGQIGAYFAPER